MTEHDLLPADHLEQPAGSKIIYQPLPDGLTITVPPRGFWKGSPGLGLVSTAWCGFMAVFTGAFFIAAKAPQGYGVLVFVAFVTVFWCIGLGLLLTAINLGRRQIAMAVAGNRLLIVQTDLFGTKRHKWGREEIAAIRSGPSNIEYNDVPQPELQIHLAAGKKFGSTVSECWTRRNRAFAAIAGLWAAVKMTYGQSHQLGTAES